MAGAIFLKFHILDVFAREKYQGNQLAVVESLGRVSAGRMQGIASEMNFSETTFIEAVDPETVSASVRIFTPREEVPFAGHPTLGTAFVLRNFLLPSPTDRVTLRLSVGDIPVFWNHSGPKPPLPWMTQNPPRFGRTIPGLELAAVLNLKEEDIDPDFPIQEVSTGLGFIIVPLRSLVATQRCRVDRDRYFSLIEPLDAKGILVFCRETVDPENHLHVRVFVDFYGVPEDPATGSGNGCLAGWLLKHKIFPEPFSLRVEQGLEIRRPSMLHLRGREEAERMIIEVGGNIVPVAKGLLL